MLDRLPEPAHLPCSDCGASVARAEQDEHACDRERWVDYQLFVRRDEVASFEEDIRAYFASPEGRFLLWEAERDREAQDTDH